MNFLKQLVYKLAANDSRNVAHFGNAIGWQGLEDEAKHNVSNPGRGITKGAINAALWWLGGEAGDALAGSGSTAGAAGDTAGTTGSTVTQAGMFGGQALTNGAFMGMDAATTQQLAEQAIAAQAAQQAATQAATQGAGAGASTLGNALTSGGGGMFSQVPGVASDSEQAAMLAAQNEGLGGTAADLTAKAAMPAVRDAYSSGQMGTLDYAGNVAKLNMAGMNDPAVWYDRLASNLGGMAKSGGKQLAMNALTGGGQRQGYQPVPFRPAQAQLPPAFTAPSSGGTSPDDMQKIMDDFKAGRITREEMMKRLGIVAA